LTELKSPVDGDQNIAPPLRLGEQLRGYALDQLSLGQFEKLNGLLSRDSRKIEQKLIERIALFNVIQQRLNKASRA